MYVTTDKYAGEILICIFLKKNSKSSSDSMDFKRQRWNGWKGGQKRERKRDTKRER